MAYGGTVKSQLPPKVPRPSLSQNDFTVKASNSAEGGLGGPTSPPAAGALPGEWHWPSLTTAGAFADGSTHVQWLVMTSAVFLTYRRR